MFRIRARNAVGWGKYGSEAARSFAWGCIVPRVGKKFLEGEHSVRHRARQAARPESIGIESATASRSPIRSR